jgi:hypothetical protein
LTHSTISKVVSNLKITSQFLFAFMLQGLIEEGLPNIILALYLFLRESRASHTEKASRFHLSKASGKRSLPADFRFANRMTELIGQLLFAPGSIKGRDVYHGYFGPVKVDACLFGALPPGKRGRIWKYGRKHGEWNGKRGM